MEVEKIRDFFESFYTCIHKLDNENYDKEFLEEMLVCMEDKLRFIAENFSEDGKLLDDFSGRFFFVYQNSSLFCKVLLLHSLGRIYKNDIRYIDMDFLRFDIKNEYEKHKEIFSTYRSLLKEMCGIVLL